VVFEILRFAQDDNLAFRNRNFSGLGSESGDWRSAAWPIGRLAGRASERRGGRRLTMRLLGTLRRAFPTDDAFARNADLLMNRTADLSIGCPITIPFYFLSRFRTFGISR
jgi:hypothetical protein